MSPTHPAFYPADLTWFDAIIGGNQPLKSAVRPNSNNLRCGQFGVSASFASICGSVRNLVGVVVLCRVPSKVVNVVVLWISVVVAAFHAQRARSDKRFQHQRMRSANCLLAIFPQRDKWPPIRFADCQGFYFVGLSVFYSSKIGHFVNAFVTHNIAPIFHRSNHIAVKGMLQYGSA